MGMENWYHPTGSPESLQGVNKMWNLLTNRSTGKYENIEVAQGRMIGCDKAAKNVGEFTFAQLCQDNRGSTDYMAIAGHFQTLIIRGVPQLSMARRDYLRRFISLIDSLYYNHRNVIIEADVALEQLFDIELTEDQIHDEEFAYTRCLSRLKEMQTDNY